MQYSESEKDKINVQSGDVIRLRCYEADGYLTTSAILVDDLLPTQPDYLRG